MDTIDSKDILLENIYILNKCCSFKIVLIKEKSITGSQTNIQQHNSHCCKTSY